jgi:hypothetical protein
MGIVGALIDICTVLSIPSVSSVAHAVVGTVKVCARCISMAVIGKAAFIEICRGSLKLQLYEL